MQIDVTNGKRFTEYDALAAVASGEDVLLVRLADGTGVKRIPINAIKAFINGDLDTLETEDKTSLIAAINEVFGLVSTNAQDIKALKELTTMLGQTGASRANSFMTSAWRCSRRSWSAKSKIRRRWPSLRCCCRSSSRPSSRTSLASLTRRSRR